MAPAPAGIAGRSSWRQLPAAVPLAGDEALPFTRIGQCVLAVAY